MSMRWLVWFGGWVVSMVMASSVSAQMNPNQDSMYSLGEEACHTVLEDQGTGKLSGAKYRHYLDTTGMEWSEFCACVGYQFRDNQKEQAPRMNVTNNDKETNEVFAEILTSNLRACLPEFGLLSQEEQHEILGGPSQAPSQRLVRRACERILIGEAFVEGFDELQVSQWEKASGLRANSLCDVCVAGEVERRREEAKAAGKSWEIYDAEFWQAMSGSIDGCMHWTYKMPLR